MHGTDNNSKKSKRVSFSVPNSPGSGTSRSRTTWSYSTSPQEPKVNKTASSNSASSDNSSRPTTATAAAQTGPVSDEAATYKDPFAGGPDPFIHTVTNTPHGLVIDGVLHPRNNQTGVSTSPQPQQPPSFPYPTQHTSFPPFVHGVPHPYPANMSTVGAGAMPDPNAQHFQPPVPDTTYGPYQYTYVPRSDPVGVQYMYPANSSVPYGVPGAVPYPQVQPQIPSPMPVPGMNGIPMIVYFNAQPGMATAPIPMMVPGGQQPPMQGYAMPPGVHVQPGAMPAMACAPPPGAPPAGPAYVAAGFGQPAPFAPPGSGLVGGGIEMGKTKAEVDAETHNSALHNQMNEPQDIKPADDDPSRMYWCREHDGEWIPRARFALDRMGNFRWYVTENGVFYAKMLIE